MKNKKKTTQFWASLKVSFYSFLLASVILGITFSLKEGDKYPVHVPGFAYNGHVTESPAFLAGLFGGNDGLEGEESIVLGVSDVPEPAIDFSRVGAFAKGYLQSEEYKNMVVEIDYSLGQKPSAEATTNLLATIELLVEKPDGITASHGNSFPNTQNEYSNADLLLLAGQNRTNYSSEETAVLNILYLDGYPEEDTESLGLALNASTFVVFSETIASASAQQSFYSDSELEEVVLLHGLSQVLGFSEVGEQPEGLESSVSLNIKKDQLDELPIESIKNALIAGDISKAKDF